MIKRLFDLVLSVLLIGCFLPVLLVIALLIVISDGLPVFFFQQRVGLHGKPFRLFKFRTMRTVKGSEKGSFDAGDSSRVTGIGRILRKTKLDELPQLFNVLCGQMSMVGPRPEVQKWVDVYPEKWAQVLTVRPGITDNASIVFRNEEEILAASNDPLATYQHEILPHKLQLYQQYVDNHGVFVDVKILVNTVFTVLFK